ncbi:hypothetical protein I8752_35425 [Nostocaceae cyanobacterium CENA369]|uniref:Uncharacterized protein n=1 Tax=Dendronalium phyllosphericum CENA369 TaxID=1725256 RepID=A0A8J7IVR2_9NOST|nr:hypothetical protein [Dendronalium phyllosphericum]MBH8578147.1 hypothetical protein [Dendronalium phyllosphericum CENA369]
MRNYLFDLIAKSFNLIDTVQPLVLSVFEPLPESTLGWELPITTESTELEITPQAEEFPGFEIVQPLEWQSSATNLQISEEVTNPLLTNLTSTPVQSSQEIPKSTSNFSPKPDLELSSNWSFPESVLTQISTDNQQLTSNTEQKTSTIPPIFASAQLLNNQPNQISPIVSYLPPSNIDNLLLISNAEEETRPNSLTSTPAQFLQKQSNNINPVVSFIQPPNTINYKPFLTQPFLESERPSTPVNQIVPNANTDVPQTKTSLSNRFISVQTRELNTFLSNSISKQKQLTPNFLPQQPISINHRLGLYLQLPIKSDLQIIFNENTTKPVILAFAPQENTFLQPNLNTAILMNAIAKPKNAPVSKLVVEKSGGLTTQSLNNQLIEISQTVSLHPLAKVLYLKQSLPQIQAETSTILSIPSFLQQGKSTTENLHKQPTEINSVFTHSQLTSVENSEAFPLQLQSQAKAISSLPFGNDFVERSTTRSLLPQSSKVNFANAPTATQVLPLIPALAAQTSNLTSTVIQPQEQLVSELPQKPTLQTENISTSEILLSQIIEQPTAIAPTTQLSPLISALGGETSTLTSTAIQTQEQPVAELTQKRWLHQRQERTLQTANIPSSEILSSQNIEQPTAIPSLQEPTRSLLPQSGKVNFANAPTTTQVLPLIPALAAQTNNLTSTVIQPQEQLVSELPQKPTLQTENISTSEILLNQIIEQPTAIPSLRDATRSLLPQSSKVSSANASASEVVLALTPVLTVDTSIPALSTVIQPQVKHEAIPTLQELLLFKNDFVERGTVSSANAFIIDTTLVNSHKQSLTPTIATQKIIDPQEKLTSNVSGVRQRFVHKNILSMHPILTDASTKLSSPQTNSSTPPFVNNLLLSATSQPATGLTAINSYITPTPTLYSSTAGTDIQSQVNFSDSYLSDFHREKASAQEVRSQNYNTNYRKHIASQKIGIVEQSDKLGQAERETNVSHADHPANMQRQKINRNEDILTSPDENLILPQNASPNFSMSADRGKGWAVYPFFRELEESDLKPLSQPINDLSVKNLSVIASSRKKAHKQSSVGLDTPPAIQVTIGQLEIRSAAPAPPPPRPKPRPAPAVMGLNEYLRRRAGGK